MRATIAGRMVLGGAGLVSTRRVLTLWGADPRSGRVVAVARILAARHLAQGAVVAAHPSRRTDIASVAVDLLHGSTMVALAAASRRYRRPATTSTCVALTLATLTGIRLVQTNSTSDSKDLRHRLVFGVIPLRPLHTKASTGSNSGSSGRSAAPVAPPTDDQQPDSAPPLELLRHEARERAAQVTRRSEDALRAATGAPMRSLSRAGSLVLLALGVWLLVGQWLLSFPFTSVASSTGLRDEGVAVVISLAALRLLTAGRSGTATSVAVLGGVLLVCSGLLADHSTSRAAVNEVACGVVAILSAIATLDRWRAGARSAGPHPVVAQLV